MSEQEHRTEVKRLRWELAQVTKEREEKCAELQRRPTMEDMGAIESAYRERLGRAEAEVERLRTSEMGYVAHIANLEAEVERLREVTKRVGRRITPIGPGQAVGNARALTPEVKALVDAADEIAAACEHNAEKPYYPPRPATIRTCARALRAALAPFEEKPSD